MFLSPRCCPVQFFCLFSFTCSCVARTYNCGVGTSDCFSFSRVFVARSLQLPGALTTTAFVAILHNPSLYILASEEWTHVGVFVDMYIWIPLLLSIDRPIYICIYVSVWRGFFPLIYCLFPKPFFFLYIHIYINIYRYVYTML